MQPRNPSTLVIINSSSCPDVVRMTFASWVHPCTERDTSCIPEHYTCTNETNMYTLAEIRLPCTTISCLTSCSAIMCEHIHNCHATLDMWFKLFSMQLRRTLLKPCLRYWSAVLRYLFLPSWQAQERHTPLRENWERPKASSLGL